MLSHVISCHKTFYHVIWKSSKMQHRWLPNNLFYKPNIICFKLFVLFLQCFIILNNTKGSILMHESLPTFVFTPLEYIYIYSMEKAMAPHSSILAWKIPWTEKPGRRQSMASLRVGDTTERLHFHFSLSCIGEGNGNPLQCSCLENPRDGGAWWASVYGVAQSRTQLKWLSCSSSIYIVTHCNSDGKESASTAGDLGSFPESGGSPGGGHGTPLQYSSLENLMDRGARWAVQSVGSQSLTRLSDFHCRFHIYKELLVEIIWII